jgi:hypothetical protein
VTVSDDCHGQSWPTSRQTSHGIQVPTRRSPIPDGKLRSRLALDQHVEKMHAWSLGSDVPGTAPASVGAASRVHPFSFTPFVFSPYSLRIFVFVSYRQHWSRERLQL